MERRVYRAIDIAQYIVSKCTLDHQPISNLQLQKILYFLQKKYLQEQGTPLFDEEIQAWQFGPVVPEVYYQYCGFGSMPITMRYDIQLPRADGELIDKVVEEERGKDPWELVEETHAPDKAWFQIYANGQGNHEVIPKSLISLKG